METRNKIRNVMLKLTTYLALLIMLICVGCFDSTGDIGPVVFVFLLCAAWVALFLVANRDYLG